MSIVISLRSFMVKPIPTQTFNSSRVLGLCSVVDCYIQLLSISVYFCGQDLDKPLITYKTTGDAEAKYSDTTSEVQVYFLCACTFQSRQCQCLFMTCGNVTKSKVGADRHSIKRSIYFELFWGCPWGDRDGAQHTKKICNMMLTEYVVVHG